ncbi:MAG: hypothetical protein HFJ09_08535 [Lachnospiraceae bacterium]|nr:hypothetical protein [Lachnospiraceae bacterium]
MQIEGVRIEGHFDIERWYQTIAHLISEREGVTVSVTVTPKDKNKKTA